MSERALVKAVTRYTVHVSYEVKATVECQLWVDEPDIREFLDMDDNDAVTDDDVEAYVLENEELNLEELVELKSIDDWDSSTVKVLTRSTAMSVPPSFVPLPGLEGEL